MRLTEVFAVCYSELRARLHLHVADNFTELEHFHYLDDAMETAVSIAADIQLAREYEVMKLRKVRCLYR